MEQEKEIRKNVRSMLTDPDLTEQDVRDRVSSLFDSLADENGVLWMNAGMITADRIWAG
jgi:hypothetical protein